MTKISKKNIKEVVRRRYGSIAKGQSQSCCGEGSSCSRKNNTQTTSCNSEVLGYSAEELAALPEGADLGLGCGNPQAITDLKLGETIIDLGSGAGIDCFLAARRVGPTGRVIGVDMTHEMLAKARENAQKDLAHYAGCVAGASLIHDIDQMLKDAGFEDIWIYPKGNSKDFIREWVPGGKVEDFIVSAIIEARKPKVQ